MLLGNNSRRLVLIAFWLVIGALAPPSKFAAERVNASYGAISGSMAQTWVAKEARLYRKVRLGSQSRLHLGRTAQHHVADRRQHPIRQSFGHARFGSLPAWRRHRVDRLAEQSTRTFAGGAEKHYQHRAIARQSPGHEHGGFLTDILLREGLRLNNISEKDVTIIPVGDLGARLSGLQTGRLHGVIIAGIQTVTATKMGFRHAHRLLQAAAGDRRLRHPGAPLLRRQESRYHFTISQGVDRRTLCVQGQARLRAHHAEKIRGNTGQEVLSTIYNLYKERCLSNQRRRCESRSRCSIYCRARVPKSPASLPKASSNRASSMNWKARVSSTR